MPHHCKTLYGLSRILICNTYYYCIQRSMSKRLFESSDHAKYYAQFRPDYPETVIQTIVNYCKLSSDEMNTAVDVGCGSGQSTQLLTEFYRKVIGVDVSEKQIENAKRRHKNIEFVVGPGEDLSFLNSCSVNLITIAQALHWLDRDKFYNEVKRVLRPNGVLAVYGYGKPVENKSEAHELVSHFYSQTLSGYWDKERHYVDEHYKSFILPFEGWTRNDDLEITKQWTVDQYIGYLTSWSAWQKYLKANPESKVLEDICNKLQILYPENELITIHWPVFMLLGTKPK